MTFARYEAVVCTQLDGGIKVFVLENEVELIPVSDIGLDIIPTKKRKRFKFLDETKDTEIIHLIDVLRSKDAPISFHKTFRGIDRAYNAMYEHKVTEKPLKFNRIRKKSA